MKKIAILFAIVIVAAIVAGCTSSKSVGRTYYHDLDKVFDAAELVVIEMTGKKPATVDYEGRIIRTDFVYDLPSGVKGEIEPGKTYDVYRGEIRLETVKEWTRVTVNIQKGEVARDEEEIASTRPKNDEIKVVMTSSDTNWQHKFLDNLYYKLNPDKAPKEESAVKDDAKDD